MLFDKCEIISRTCLMFLVYIQLQTMYEYESGYKVKDVMLMTFFLFFNKQAAELVR